MNSNKITDLAQFIVNGPMSTVNLYSPGNWPLDASYAVVYTVHDRQFPQVNHDTCIDFFVTADQAEAWLAEKKEWMKSTDYDFSMETTWYEWDLGPNLSTFYRITSGESAVI